MSGTDHYYSFNNPLTENYVQELINKAEEAIQGPGTAFAFVKAIVTNVNIKKKRIEINNIEGLLS